MASTAAGRFLAEIIREVCLDEWLPQPRLKNDVVVVNLTLDASIQVTFEATNKGFRMSTRSHSWDYENPMTQRESVKEWVRDHLKAIKSLFDRIGQ